MPWERRAEGPPVGLAEVRVGRTRIRVRLRVIPRCRPSGRTASSTHVSLPAPPPSYARRVRRGVHLVQGTPEPASPPSDAGLVPLRRTRDLVDGGRRERRGRPPAAADL